jgi:hypothetical protein
MTMSMLQVPISEAWERAHKDVVNDPASHKAAYLLETIGPRITSAALGLADARQLKRWAAENVEPREHAVALRLDAVYWVVRALAPVYPPAVAARFLRSANPQLGDEAPLVVLARADDERSIGPVLAVARAFLEG